MGSCSDDGSTKSKAQFVFDDATNALSAQKKKIKNVVGVRPDINYDSVRLFVEGAANDSFDACHEDGWKLKTLKEKFTIKLKTLKEKSIILNTHGRCWS